MKPASIPVLALLAMGLLGVLPAPVAAQEGAAEEVVTVAGGTMEVDELVVASGTGLVLRGVDVRVNRSIVVAPDAFLRLEPFEGRPTRLAPVDATAGFWIRIEGHIESEGLPETEVHGVNGDVLDSAAHYMPGSFQINGTAVLRDLYFHNSTAGFLVTPTGHMVLERSRLIALDLMAVAALGRVEVADSQFIDSSISISGRSSCNVTVRDSTFYSLGGHLQMNRCPLTATNITGRGASTGIVLLGHGPYRFEDVHLEGYLGTGLRGDGSAEIYVANSTFVAGPGARNGINLKPDHNLTLINVTVSGGRRHAVEIQSSTVHIEGGRFVRSGGYGIALVLTPWSMPLEAAQVIDFGLGTPDANALGGLDVRRVLYAQAVNEEGLPVRGLELEVVDRSTGEILYQTTGPSNASSILVDLPLLREEGGQLVPRGPFDYVAHHEAARSQRGTLDPEQPLLQIELTARPVDGLRPALLVTFVLGALGVLLLTYALFDQPIKRWVRGRMGRGGGP